MNESFAYSLIYYIVLAENVFGNEGVRILCEALKSNSSLSKLSLNCCERKTKNGMKSVSEPEITERT